MKAGRKIRALEGIVWTRERILEAAGFDYVGDTRAAIERMRKIVRSRDEYAALRAIDLTYDVVGVKARKHEVEDGTAPVKVEIYLSHQADVVKPAPVEIVTEALQALPPSVIKTDLEVGS